MILETLSPELPRRAFNVGFGIDDLVMSSKGERIDELMSGGGAIRRKHINNDH
jgi:hypothetical protein